MPKAKKSSKKDTSSFIKKVASAGRGGDSELAYLSPKARDLLKKLGGAGTMNPATGLKEYKAAARFARTAQDSLDEFNALRQATLDRMAEQTLAPPAAPIAERETIQPTFEEETITPAPAPAPAPVQTPVISESMLAALRAAQQRQAQPPDVTETPMPAAPAPGTAAADLAQFSERDMIPRGGEQEAITPAPAPAPITQSPYTMQFDPSRLRAPDTAATNLAQLMEVGQPYQEPMASTPAAIMQAREQEARDMIPREEDVAVTPAPSPGYTPLTPAQLAALANIQASGFGRLTTGPNATGPSWTDLFAEEEKRRAAAEEAARKAAEEEAARKAAEEAAARRAAEEAARRAAEEEARRRAEEQARYIAEQEAAARRAAEEARRVAAEAEARRLADEEARRRALEEEARRRAEPPAPPPTPPLQTTLPPGLITSPLPTPPPPPTTQPPAAAPPTSTTTPAEPPPPPRPQGINLFNQTPGGFFSAIDSNSDIGRLIAKLRERGAGRGFSGVTGGTPNAPISPIAQIAGSLPTASASMPTSPVQSAVAPTAGLGALSNIPIPVTQLPTPGYTAAPLPQLVGAGTPTPFFNPSAGGLTPGTVPVSQMPQSLQTADVPLQALAANPNLSPTVLGGRENLGYYVDRFGNVILAPATPRGRKEGGPASDAELLQALQEGSGGEDMASAKAMLEQLSNEPPESRTEVKLSPTAQSVRRVSRRPIRAETDRGVAKGMAMELEEITKSQGPRAKGRAEEMQQRMELIRNTLGIPTFSKAGLGRAGDLLAKRFAEGGDAQSDLTELLSAAREKLFGVPEEEGPAVQGPLPKPGPGTRRYFEERGRALQGSPPTGIEREAQIRAKLGPEYQEAITKLGETAMIGDPMEQWSLQGINFTPNKSREEMTKYMENKLEPILSSSPERKLPEGKRIFAIGRKATPQIYAHELRHEGIFDEGYNRVMDLVNSGSAPAYRDNIESLYNYHMANDPVYENADESGQDFLARKVPFKDKERYVLNIIRPSLTRYFQKEAPVFSGGDWGSEILRQNYNLNALGAKGAVKDTGEQLQRKVIKERARYPFLNFVGRENMPVAEEEKNQFALPPYLDSSISDSTRKALLPLPEAVIKHLNQVQKNKKK